MADFTSIKEAGNAEFKKENWEAARNLYAQALALDSTSEAAGTLYSNRAACHVKAGDYDLGKDSGPARNRLQAHSYPL